MQILAIAALTFVASIIGTMSGFGLSTIMVPVLLLFLPLPQTLLFVGIIHLFGDVWKMLLFREGIRWKLILSFGIPGAIASFFGARLIFSVPEAVLSRLLGIVLIAYAGYLLAHRSFKIREQPAVSAGVGVSSGFLAGIFGVGGAVRAMFLSAFDLPKAVYIATSGAIASVIDLTRLATYLAGGATLTLVQWQFLPLFVIVSFFGAQAAQKIVLHVPQKQFRMVVAAFLLLVGLRFLVAA
jgi:hypothetical protein